MNRTENKFDLEQLLGTVEHAGRDSRRQQQLSELIDGLAAEESRQHRAVAWRRWSIGISAAACIALFVTWFVKFESPSVGSPQGPLVAERKTDTVLVPQTVEDSAIVLPVGRAVRRYETVAGVTPDAVEYLAESAPIEVTDTVEDVISEGDTLFDPEELLREIAVQLAEADKQEVVPVEESRTEVKQPVAVVQNEKPNRRNWFKFQRSQPSKMDGTMLAFRLM